MEIEMYYGDSGEPIIRLRRQIVNDNVIAEEQKWMNDFNEWLEKGESSGFKCGFVGSGHVFDNVEQIRLGFYRITHRAELIGGRFSIPIEGGEVTRILPDNALGFIMALSEEEKIKYNAQKFGDKLWWFVPNDFHVDKFIVNHPNDTPQIKLL